MIFIVCLFFFQEFVATLDLPTKDKILVNLLSMGRGSLDFAKTLITVDSAPEPPLNDIPAPVWCKCRVCRPMPSDEENLCCKTVTCVTSYTSCSNICLDRDILEVCIKADVTFVMTTLTSAWKALEKLVTGSLHSGAMVN